MPSRSAPMVIGRWLRSLSNCTCYKFRRMGKNSLLSLENHQEHALDRECNEERPLVRRGDIERSMAPAAVFASALVPDRRCWPWVLNKSMKGGLFAVKLVTGDETLRAPKHTRELVAFPAARLPSPSHLSNSPLDRRSPRDLRHRHRPHRERFGVQGSNRARHTARSLPCRTWAPTGHVGRDGSPDSIRASGLDRVCVARLRLARRGHNGAAPCCYW
jgi:hypothetical protein